MNGYIVWPIGADVFQVEADAAADGGVEVFAGESGLHEVVVGDGDVDQGFAEGGVFEVGTVVGELVVDINMWSVIITILN